MKVWITAHELDSTAYMKVRAEVDLISGPVFKTDVIFPGDAFPEGSSGNFIVYTLRLWAESSMRTLLGVIECGPINLYKDMNMTLNVRIEDGLYMSAFVEPVYTHQKTLWDHLMS